MNKRIKKKHGIYREKGLYNKKPAEKGSLEYEGDSQFAISRKLGENYNIENFLSYKREDGLWIVVHPVESKYLYGNEYFKVLDHFWSEEPTKVARISFYTAEYIQHPDDDTKEAWILNKEEKEKLVKRLKQIEDNYHGLNNWQMLLQYHNDERGFCNHSIVENTTNRKGKRKFPNYFPVDFPMPNYMDLPE